MPFGHHPFRRSVSLLSIGEHDGPRALLYLLHGRCRAAAGVGCVLLAHPPIALKRRISLYLTIRFPFSRWSRDAPRVPTIDSRKEKPGDAGFWWKHRCAPTGYGTAHRRGVESCTDWCVIFKTPITFSRCVVPRSVGALFRSPPVRGLHAKSVRA